MLVVAGASKVDDELPAEAIRTLGPAGRRAAAQKGCSPHRRDHGVENALYKYGLEHLIAVNRELDGLPRPSREAIIRASGWLGNRCFVVVSPQDRRAEEKSGLHRAGCQVTPGGASLRPVQQRADRRWPARDQVAVKGAVKAHRATGNSSWHGKSSTKQDQIGPYWRGPRWGRPGCLSQ